MSQRNYGIDLLRLVLMYMVCLLHTLGQGGLLQAAAPGSAGFALLWLLEVLAYCAVDGFAMISGFTASDRPQKYVKIVDMWFQVFFYLAQFEYLPHLTEDLLDIHQLQLQ